MDFVATKLVEVSDLHGIASHIRSKDATARFQLYQSQADFLPLWTLLFWQLQTQLVTQHAIVDILSILDAAPHCFMLKLLQYSEAHGINQSLNEVQGRVCVLWHFVATFITTLLDIRSRGIRGL